MQNENFLTPKTEPAEQKRLFVFKVILLTVLLASTGLYFYGNFVNSLYYVNVLNSLGRFNIQDVEQIKNIEYFVNGSPKYFFLFMFVALAQWIMFSENLPKGWLFASLLGSIVAGLLESTSQNLLFIPKDPLMELRVDFWNGFFLVGIVASMPQWILLRKESKIKNYYWLAINSIGWGVVGYFLNQELAISYTFGFGEIKVLFFDWIRDYRLWHLINYCSFLPLGLGIGLFFAESK